MQFLVYYWATDMLQWEVINGDEKGTDISKISEYNEVAKYKLNAKDNALAAGSIINFDPKAKVQDELFPYKDNIAFLDHSNGDYYCLKTPTIDVTIANDDTARTTNLKGRFHN